jgi:hypothetical protein
MTETGMQAAYANTVACFGTLVVIVAVRRRQRVESVGNEDRNYTVTKCVRCLRGGQ